jgi:KDO2-lipid IV(A) lauroyltransferase
MVKDRIAHWALRGLTAFIHFTPFAVVPWLARSMAFVLQYVVRYRRTTAIENLKRCFPDKTALELRQVLSGVYFNLMLVLLETIKEFSSSQRQISSRITPPAAAQLEIFNTHFRGAILVTAHLGNWEWGGYCITEFLKGQGIAVYRPLKNRGADTFVRARRKKSQLLLIPMQEIVRSLARGESRESYIYLIADQSPDPDHAHWEPFFGIQTPFFRGPAVLAHRYDLPVFFVHMERIRPLSYRMILEPLCLNPSETPPATITAAYVASLERQIRKRPTDWLWTHRRWKHSRPDPSPDHNG